MKRIEMLRFRPHHKNENGTICENNNKFIWITTWSIWWVIFNTVVKHPVRKKNIFRISCLDGKVLPYNT